MVRNACAHGRKGLGGKKSRFGFVWVLSDTEINKEVFYQLKKRSGK